MWASATSLDGGRLTYVRNTRPDPETRFNPTKASSYFPGREVQVGGQSLTGRLESLSYVRLQWEPRYFAPNWPNRSWSDGLAAPMAPMLVPSPSAGSPAPINGLPAAGE